MSGEHTYIAWVTEVRKAGMLYEVRAEGQSQVGMMLVEHSVTTFTPLGSPQPLIGQKVTITLHPPEESQ